jgi:hypothetical protein
MSKGSRPRPYSVSQDQFANNYDAIFGKKKTEKIEEQVDTKEEFDRFEEHMVKDSDQGG